MKKRFSLNKAEWTINKEEQYRKDCEDILYKNGKQIFIVDNEVYLKSDESNKLLAKINKPQSMWYEI